MSSDKSSRNVVMRVIVPRLRAKFPTGHVGRQLLLSECASAGIPWQPWLLSKPIGKDANDARVRLYDISHLYGESDAVVKGGAVVGSGVVDEDSADSTPDTRSDDEVERVVRDRFSVLDTMASGVASGRFVSVILSGPPGIGKTYSVERMLEETRGIEYERVAGFSRATGLYKLLSEHRAPNHVVLIDDCDSVFEDSTALALLKAACDGTGGKRTLHWRAETKMEDEDGEIVDRHFNFEGRIVFVTNLNFEAHIRSGSKISTHLSALMSRSFYVDLNMTRREVLSRVVSVARRSPILAHMTAKERDRIIAYVKDNANQMREVSLRSLTKLSQILGQVKSDEDFVRIAGATLLRR